MGPLYDGPNPLPCHWQEVKTLKSNTKEIQSKMGSTVPNTPQRKAKERKDEHEYRSSCTP